MRVGVLCLCLHVLCACSCACTCACAHVCVRARARVCISAHYSNSTMSASHFSLSNSEPLHMYRTRAKIGFSTPSAVYLDVALIVYLNTWVGP